MTLLLWPLWGKEKKSAVHQLLWCLYKFPTCRLTPKVSKSSILRNPENTNQGNFPRNWLFLPLGCYFPPEQTKPPSYIPTGKERSKAECIMS